ncbi:MAG: RNase H family protein, partial [Chloroflexota bacterium]
MKEWLADWERRGWKTAAGQPVKNLDLWQQLDSLSRGRQVEWRWIKGHAGHPENERCDTVAAAAARRAARARPS